MEDCVVLFLYIRYIYIYNKGRAVNEKSMFVWVQELLPVFMKKTLNFHHRLPLVYLCGELTETLS